MIRYIYNELYSYAESTHVINTHSHHREDSFYPSLNLEQLLKESYVNWCGISFDNSEDSRRNYLDKVRYNSYFIWLEKALQKIYGFNEPVTAQNWDQISDLVQKANSRSEHHLNILKNNCKYEKVILDTYWNPGSSINHPDIFTPTFRINTFLYGYSKHSLDHNGNSPLRLYGMETDDIDEYIAAVRRIVVNKKASGCIALKSALAYDRGLDFEEIPKNKAQKVLKEAEGMITREDIKAFGDYVFFEICRMAAELNLPIQCHTGLGQLKRTNAMQMQEVIEKNPDTKFVLFHGGYPWLEDIYALLHNYRNVYPDLCWLPLISTSAAARMTEELIEVGTIDKTCWGCDTWTSEESFGALMAVRHVLAQALSEKVSIGYLSISDAKTIIGNILYNNAKKLYYPEPIL